MVKRGDEFSQADKERFDGRERRQHERVAVPLKGRYLDHTRQEHPCTVANISAGGALIRAKFPPAFGKSVIVYIDKLGRFEGRVVRSDADSFAVAFEHRSEKTKRTAEQITALAKGAERRKEPRIRQDAPAVVYFEDGRAAKCAILDISLTGASIEINPRPPLGARVILGRMNAKVVRRHDTGVGVVFTGAAERLDDAVMQTQNSEPAPQTNTKSFSAPFGRKNPT